jgi:glucosamine 6-phosphate synthetase-like amidotransferase/phosphosugar isomerase protein
MKKWLVISEEIKARRGKVIVIATEGNEKIKKSRMTLFIFPKL